MSTTLPLLCTDRDVFEQNAGLVLYRLFFLQIWSLHNPPTLSYPYYLPSVPMQNCPNPCSIVYCTRVWNDLCTSRYTLHCAVDLILHNPPTFLYPYFYDISIESHYWLTRSWMDQPSVLRTLFLSYRSIICRFAEASKN